MLEPIHSRRPGDAVVDVGVVQWYILARDYLDGLLAGDATKYARDIVQFGVAVPGEFLGMGHGPPQEDRADQIGLRQPHRGSDGADEGLNVGGISLQGGSTGVKGCPRIPAPLLPEGIDCAQGNVPQEGCVLGHLVRVHGGHDKVGPDLLLLRCNHGAVLPAGCCRGRPGAVAFPLLHVRPGPHPA